ncbi:hypothetical protein EMCRGX_G008279 [Ephydatia muelleri]
MVGVQEGLGSYVPGFTFNLGFSGGLFSHGDPLEVEGSKEIVRVAEKFWWFEHMVQAPEEPHLGTEEQLHPEYCLCQAVFNPLTPCLQVLPRQTCKLFSYHYSLESYQGGLERHLLKEGDLVAQPCTLPNVNPLLPKSHTDVCISNGMVWSPGNTKMYHIYSGLRKLWSFNFDDVSSCLTNRQVLPRQTCKLFSYHYSLESYQGGLERHLLKEGKCLRPQPYIITLWTVVPRQTCKLFSYHYSLESYQGGLERHLLKEGKCFETTTLYFTFFPDDIIPVWTVSGVVMGRREGVDWETQHQLALVDQDYPKNRMNDSKCDSRGRLWCGIMGYEKNLYPAKEARSFRNERVCFPNTPDVSMTTGANRYILGSIFEYLSDFRFSAWSATAPASCDATLLEEGA